MMKWYKLVNKVPVQVEDFLDWVKSQEEDKSVARTTIGEVVVSTVFLGIDHRLFFQPKGLPILFETMIFGGVADEFQERYETWEQAEEGHKKAVDMVLGMVSLETEMLKNSVIKSLN